MANNQYDSFLPSGAIDASRSCRTSTSTVTDPLTTRAELPPDPYIPFAHGDLIPRALISPPSERRYRQHPISPPKTRSASAENTAAKLLEDWKIYTDKLRLQGEVEREHAMADRARWEKLYREERELAERRESLLRARIGELEAEVDKLRNDPKASPPVRPEVSLANVIPESSSIASPDSSTASRISSRFDVPQASGRNRDGTPFYAPAPANPKRTFEPSEASNLTVDDMQAHRQDPFTVTSKNLTAADFLRSPTSDSPSLPSPKKRKTDTLGDSIDISRIQPELEGISIKTTALEPAVVAKIMSPKESPSLASPTNHHHRSQDPSGSLARSRSPIGHKTNENKPDTVQVASQPVERRLVMHAGHTPNHSLSRINLLKDDESTSITPRQVHRPLVSIAQADGSRDLVGIVQTGYDHVCDEDPPLRGPLHLPSQPSSDEPFVYALCERLEAHRKSQNSSPISSSNDSESHKAGDAKSDNSDEPRLKLKPSTNFGMPFGQA